VNYTGKTKAEYKATWGTPIGKDCVSLDTTLCKWLGDRLVFSAAHASGHPLRYSHKRWKRELSENGNALLVWANHYDTDYGTNHDKETEDYANAQRALRWVARKLGNLWD